MYDRTARHPYGPYRLSKRRRRWDGVSWWLSSIFAIALLAWGLTWWFGIRGDDGANGVASSRVVTFQVTSAEDGRPIQGAIVSFPGGSASTGSDGSVALNLPDGAVELSISATGFEPVYGTADPGIDDRQSVALRPSSTSAVDDSALAPAASEPTPTVEAQSADQSPAVQNAPTEAAPTVDLTPTAATGAPTPPGEATADPGAAIAGTILDQDGNPIWDATVLFGSTFARTAQDGTFRLANVPVGSEVEVWASGYADQRVTAAQGMQVRMTRQNINAAYLTGAKLTDEATIQAIIDLAKTTDINAVVIDMKEGTVYYDTDVQFFIDADAVFPAFDPASLVKRFEEAGLYTIARIVVFNDPVVAENRPELAIRTVDGGVWRGWNGAAWVNPYHQELWQPNIDLGLEAARMGFDEVQFDYVRFPSDGDLSIAEFGTQYTYAEDERVDTIASFLSMARDQLTAAGVKTAADVFAIIAIFPDDQGIGQRFADFTKVVDYICPMIYPSHFTAGPLGLDGSPNAMPYETVLITMNSAAKKVPGEVLKIRPWIQDFTMGDPPYGVPQVADQVRAVAEAGGSGWMLWNPNSQFTAGALGNGDDMTDGSGQ